MAVVWKRVVVSAGPEQEPIELLTENGFSIFRRCESERTVPTGGWTYQFLVTDPDRYQLLITVRIAKAVINEIHERCRSRISVESLYWITLAERHLAEYLYENGDYPPNAVLIVEHLEIDDIDLARRWNCEE